MTRPKGNITDQALRLKEKPNAVVVVMDMVEDMFKCPELSIKRTALVGSVNKLVSVWRNSGHKIVWIKQEYQPDLSDAPLEYRLKGIFRTIRGAHGSEFLPELDISRDDDVIVKKRYSAFFGTDLDDRLRKFSAQNIIVAGVNTHACVRMTAIDAYQRDYPIFIFEECVASYDQEHHDISLRYMHDKVGSVLKLEIPNRL